MQRGNFSIINPCAFDRHLGLSASGEGFVPAARQSLLHGLHDVLHAAPVAHPHLVALPLAGGPDLLKVRNDVVAPKRKPITSEATSPQMKLFSSQVTVFAVRCVIILINLVIGRVDFVFGCHLIKTCLEKCRSSKSA